MNKSRITLREKVMLMILVALLAAVAYYMGFYQPLQEDMSRIDARSMAVDEEIIQSSQKLKQKKDMQQELDEILSRPRNQITEFAPYDNKEVVLDILYGILGRTQDYSLSFTDPEVQEDGTVRREISLQFSCGSYEAAKQVVQDLSRCKWRCLITSCSIANRERWHEEDDDYEYQNDIMEEPVDVTMTLTFFESSKLTKT